MRSFFYRFFIELTNHRLSSYIIKSFAQSKLSKWIVPSFAKVYNINQEEMHGELSSFPTLQQLFIRTLKPGARKIDEASNTIVSPVDAVVEKSGSITENLEMIVKGKHYSIKDMLSDESIATKYMGGTYVILYLSPSHYHRIHSPIAGRVTSQWTLGKKSYPVNRLGLLYGKDPLSKNFRKITELESDGKHVAVVKVGAMFVNSIEMTHKGEVLQKGEDMAYFSFGSTVILLFEKDTVELNETLKEKADVKVGEVIASWK